MHAHLFAWRKSTGLTQQKVAEVLKVTHATVSRWEKGKQKIPPSKLKALADLYEASMAELLVPPTDREMAENLHTAFEIVSKMDREDVAQWLAIGKSLAEKSGR